MNDVGIYFHRKQSIPSERLKSAMVAVMRNILSIGLLLMSSLAFAEDRLPDLTVAEIIPMEIRYGWSRGESVAINQAGFAFHAAAPRWLHANRLEFGLGAISRGEQSRPFLSLGPVWRWVPSSVEKRWFIDFGLSPTVLGGAKFDGKDLGGNLHFTSSLAIGRHFGARSASTVSLRIQQMSNLGLNSTNPGVTMIGLSFTYRPNNRGQRASR
jgi:hypothetical protein